jgi:MoxR-like ATPase
MRTWEAIRIYRGEGEAGGTLPLFDQGGWDRLHDPAGYLAEDGLCDAANVAVSLGLPLLITGEPGTGKTEFAHSLAWEIGAGEPFVFQTKSTSVYSDLFYRYDAMRHFQDVHIRRMDCPVENYIIYGPLGRAILRAANRTDKFLPTTYQNEQQQRSVVLVDEIDKAPHDLPNDILNELESMSFEVRELGHTFKAVQAYRPILVLTSNLERELPEAFRRRCAFYHINFPTNDARGEARLKSIIRRRLPKSEQYTPEMLSHAVRLFLSIRELPLEKKPSTAEMINWIDLLQRIALNVKDGKDLDNKEYDILAASFALLAKSDEDLRKLRMSFVR